MKQRPWHSVAFETRSLALRFTRDGWSEERLACAEPLAPSLQAAMRETKCQGTCFKCNEVPGTLFHRELYGVTEAFYGFG